MDDRGQNEDSKTIRVKTPKRVLHCSDGVYEEYSEDEEPINKENLQDISTMRKIAHNLVYGLDYVGEAIASFLNITTPKYAYEINQFKKMEEERAKEAQEMKDNTWQVENEQSTIVTVAPAQQQQQQSGDDKY
jgi:hypothetical protein